MTSALLPVSEVMEYLGEENDQEIPVVERLIDQIEALFLTQCGRRDRPFRAAQSARVEVHDGTGSRALVLQYPVAAVTSVLIGADPLTPDETLAVADVKVLRWAAGSATLRRVDGGTFGVAGDPRTVHVTYNAQADLPLDAQLAILRVVAACYRQRGSEDASSERMGGYSGDLARVAESEPTWQMAVAAHSSPVFA